MASLLSLPPEIFEAVLEDVDGDDVLSLRRVNRRISALSTHQFGLKCLADLSFLCHQVYLNSSLIHWPDTSNVLLSLLMLTDVM
ncbi:hypothetical protein D6D11_10572 [Aureobasidium pullulans]|nr:hypothetical protein D6D11_10572 [Aureobasidium pullulans]